jgi:hypothetical protein
MKDTHRKEVTHIKEFHRTEREKKSNNNSRKKHNDFPCQNRYYIYIYLQKKQQQE